MADRYSDERQPLSIKSGRIKVGMEVGRLGWSVGARVAANFALDHVHGDLTAEAKATGLGALVDGVLAEYKVVPAHALVRIPDHLTHEEAATLPCAAVTAYNALMGPNPLKGGDTVLVQGTGGVSVFALQLAVASGATVIVTSSSDEKLAIARTLGAAHTVNYKDTPEWDEEVLKITKGRGVDRIIEVGGPATIMKSVNCIRYGGTISLIGRVAGVEADVSELPVKVISKTVTMRGILIGSRASFEDMNRLIEAVKLRPVVDRVFSFEEAREAYEYMARQEHVGKVVVKVSKD
ncbi:NAD(P)-binding protein [Trametes sanguinea]|nr:NAD(P)-binding protein [Trametes sanguinea]